MKITNLTKKELIIFTVNAFQEYEKKFVLKSKQFVIIGKTHLRGLIIK